MIKQLAFVNTITNPNNPSFYQVHVAEQKYHTIIYQAKWERINQLKARAFIL